MLSEFEKFIYNTHLSTSRKQNNKPYRLRQDFDSFENSEDFVTVVKLGKFFSKFPNINIKDFFEAPYFVYEDKFFDLKYYTSQKAIQSYTIYQNKFLVNDPDSSKTLEKIKDSFIFIRDHCKANNIPVENYINRIDTGKQFHDFILHLKERNIIVYSLFVFPNFEKIILSYDKDLKKYVLGDTIENLNFYRTKYYGSQKAKKLCILMHNKLISQGTNL